MLRSCLICLVFLAILPGCGLLAPEYDLNHPPSSQNYSNLDAAITYANQVGGEINSPDTEVGVVRTTSNFALLGAALSVAGVAAFTSSRDAIIGLGLGSAGILGYQYETAISSRQTIFDNARAAIACAEQSALIMSEQNPGATPPAAPAVGPGVAAAVPPAAAVAPAAAALVPSTSASAQSLSTLAYSIETIGSPAAAASPPPGAAVHGHYAAAAAPIAPALAPVAAVVQQASSDQIAAAASVQSALANTAAKAPQFLVFTVRNVEIATISLLHASEPQGQDLVNYVNGQTQKATSATQNSLQSAKKTTDTNASTAAGATKVAAASTPDPAKQSQVQQSNAVTQANLANTSQQLSVVSKTLSDAGDCKQLGGSSFVNVPGTSTSTSPTAAGS